MLNEGRLTIVIPTRNRPSQTGRLVRYLRRCGAECEIILADSSDPEAASVNRSSAASADVIYRHFPPETAFYQKLGSVVSDVRTVHVALLPDDDIPLPQAIVRCSNYLADNADFTCASGYVLDYAIFERQFDLISVRWFSPSVDQTSPFARLYELVRRYQPSFWAVFDREALYRSLLLAREPLRLLLCEMTFMLSMVLSGKIARLPTIHMLRSRTKSLYNRAEVEPQFAFHENASLFTMEYADYRDRLLKFASGELAIDLQSSFVDCSPEQFMDVVHGIALLRELDAGPLNYLAQRALGAPLDPIPQDSSAWPWRELSRGDLATPSALQQRNYIWRNAVRNAEPRHEITISPAEMKIVEQQLDHYV